MRGVQSREEGADRGSSFLNNWRPPASLQSHKVWKELGQGISQTSCVTVASLCLNFLTGKMRRWVEERPPGTQGRSCRNE